MGRRDRALRFLRRHRRVWGVRSLAAILVIGIPTGLGAQPPWQLGVNGLFGFPQGAFNDNLNDKGYGLSAQLLYRVRESSVNVGGDFGWLRYGRDTRFEPISTRVPEIGFEIRTNYDIFLGHFLMRWEPSTNAPVRPYLDGLIGITYLATQSEVDNGFSGLASPILTTTHFDDLAFSGGGAAGLRARLSGNEGGASLDVRVRYLIGSEADYLAEGGLTTRDGDVFLDVSRSRTDLLTFSVGLLFGL